MDGIKVYIEYIAKLIEVVGVLTIGIGAVVALGKFILSLNKATGSAYKLLRQDLGKSILLGLEILVAADIIATVVTEPTMERVLILAVIVLIRTFLSLSLQVEIEGKFPWQKEERTRP